VKDADPGTVMEASAGCVAITVDWATVTVAASLSTAAPQSPVTRAQ
jgi:hypothetical protein